MNAKTTQDAIRKKWWQNISLMILLLAPLMGFVMASWDQAFVSAFQNRDLPGDIEKGLQLSEAFAHGSGVLVIFSILLTVDRKNRRQLLVMLGMVVTIMAIANLSKGLFSRARPYAGSELKDLTQTWFPDFGQRFWDSRVRSFPSGHSATAAAMAFALSNVYPSGRFLFVTLAIMACLQRIATQSHFPTDVVAGVTIAAAIALLWQFLFPRSTLDRSAVRLADSSSLKINDKLDNYG